jgi:hypothetical protein
MTSLATLRAPIGQRLASLVLDGRTAPPGQQILCVATVSCLVRPVRSRPAPRSTSPNPNLQSPDLQSSLFRAAERMQRLRTPPFRSSATSWRVAMIGNGCLQNLDRRPPDESAAPSASDLTATPPSLAGRTLAHAMRHCSSRGAPEQSRNVLQQRRGPPPALFYSMISPPPLSVGKESIPECTVMEILF